MPRQAPAPARGALILTKGNFGSSTHDRDRTGVGYALVTVAICQMRLAQPQDGHEGLVNAPLLFRVHPAYQITEAPSVNGAGLFD